MAAARIFASRGAKVHALDLNPIDENSDNNNGCGGDQRIGNSDNDSIIYTHCDVTDWARLRQIFIEIGHVDIAVANAGVSQECDYFADTFDADGKLEEPSYAVLDVNYRAVLNFVKLSLSAFRKQGRAGGSVVIISSATAYASEQTLPVYSATKMAVRRFLFLPLLSSILYFLTKWMGKMKLIDDIGTSSQLIALIRALRPTIHMYGATINGVAPGATLTKLLPADLAKPIIAAGAPVSNAHHVGLAVAYSAVATQQRQVEGYGRDSEAKIESSGRWNGRVILTLGDRWTEIEEPIALLRKQWMGDWNAEMTAFQQMLTDTRPE